MGEKLKLEINFLTLDQLRLFTYEIFLINLLLEKELLN